MRAIYRRSETELLKIKGKQVVIVGYTPSFFENGFIKHATPHSSVLEQYKKLPTARKKDFLKAFKETIKLIKL